MRPDPDEECDYPHPPPRRYEPAPPTFRETIWPIMMAGAVMGSLVGFVLGLWFTSEFAAYPPPSPDLGSLISILWVLAGIVVGSIILPITLCPLVVFEILVPYLSDLVIRRFRRKGDPDADITDPL